MIDHSQWAKQITVALADTYASRSTNIIADLTARAESILLRVQIDTVEQCLRLTQQAMNEARPLQAIGIGKVVDRISDFAIALNERSKPSDKGTGT